MARFSQLTAAALNKTVRYHQLFTRFRPDFLKSRIDPFLTF